MPVIRVEMFKGRTHEQKHALPGEVTDAFVRSCGSNFEAVMVVMTDIEKQARGSGGELCADKYPE